MTTLAETVDPSWKGLYKWGGVSAVLGGVLVFICVALAFALGSPPSGGQAVLNYLSGKTTLAYTLYGLFIVADMLTVPVVLALYLALKRVNKNAMLAAAVFAGLGTILDLGVTTISWIGLITLSQNYAAATSSVQSAAYVAAANYVLAVTAVSAPIFSIVISSIGALIISLVMLKGIFNKATAYMGIAASIVGFIYGISVFGPSLTIFLIIAFLLNGIWYLLLGYRLYRLGKP
jgi:hypothetical protein